MKTNNLQIIKLLLFPLTVLLYINVSAQVNKAHQGILQTIPGVIDPAWFDEGGEGVAYHDMGQVNSFCPGVRGFDCLRSNTGVGVVNSPIYPSTLGFTNVGEWTNYTVEVTETGIYNAQLTYSTSINNDPSRRLDMLIDGNPINGFALVPTGDWHLYGVSNANGINLTKGTHVLTLRIAGFAEYNYNQIQFIKDKNVAGQKPTLNVVLMGGQSNMVGFAPVNSPAGNLSDNLKKEYTPTRIIVSGEASHGWGFVRPGLSIRDEWYGNEVTFSRDFNNALNLQESAIIKCAWGGTNLGINWRPPSSGGNTGPLYNGFIDVCRRDLGYLALTYTVNVVALTWMQGESDAVDGNLSIEYEKNLRNFVQDVRRDLALPNLPIAIGMIDVQPTWMYSDWIRNAQVKIANEDPNIITFDTRGLETDGIHYQTIGMQGLGHRFANAVRSVMDQNLISYERQIPYLGVPQAIPGVIECENFDKGGQATAYFDDNIGNNSSQYRTYEGEDVDIEVCTEGGFNIDFTASGEWLSYTVNIAETAIYKMDARLATPVDGNKILIKVDGHDRTGIINVPNTGGWQNWQDVSSELFLTSGKHIITLLFVESNGLNANKLTFTKTQNLNLGDGTGLTGNYFSGMNFETSVFSRTDKTIDFNWGVGSPDAALPIDGFSVRWEGEIQPLFSETYTFAINSDNGRRLWINDQLIIDKWISDWGTEYTGQITLQAGQKYSFKMEYYEEIGGAAAKLEWQSATQAREVVSTTQLYPKDIVSGFSGEELSKLISIYPNPAQNIVSITLPESTIDYVELVDVNGNSLFSQKNSGSNQLSLDLNGVKNGMYFLKIETNNIYYTQKISIQK